MRRDRGFTLIELVMVMIVVSVGLLGIASLFSTTSNALSTNETLQQAAQYAQECAERVTAVRRDLGFISTSINDVMCNLLGALPPGFTRTLTGTGSTDTYIGGASTACPNGVTCRNVGVTVAGNSVSSSITVMLVDY